MPQTTVLDQVSTIDHVTFTNVLTGVTGARLEDVAPLAVVVKGSNCELALEAPQVKPDAWELSTSPEFAILMIVRSGLSGPSGAHVPPHVARASNKGHASAPTECQVTLDAKVNAPKNKLATLSRVRDGPIGVNTRCAVRRAVMDSTHINEFALVECPEMSDAKETPTKSICATSDLVHTGVNGPTTRHAIGHVVPVHGATNVDV